MRDFDPSCERPRRAFSDPFFAPGNWIAFHDCVTILYLEENTPLVKTNETESNKSDARVGADHSSSFPCGVPGCSKVFRSELDYEQHYESQHSFVCSECGMIFSCNRLLDVHLREAHDSFFSAALQRKQARFSCLVQDCSLQFDSLGDRHEHLQSQHGYPHWFRFPSHIPYVGQDARKKRRWLKVHHKHNSVVVSENKDHSEYAANNRMQEVDDKKQARRQRQKEKRATIPCRFYLSRNGCWRGEKCDFLHEARHHQTVNAQQDMDMDDLAERVERKARISVPEKISFGHGHKGFLS